MKIGILAFLFLPIATLVAQSNIEVPAIEKSFGVYQKAKNSDKPGIYSQVAYFSKTTANPGEIIEINYLITGYGMIDYKTVKLHLSPSAPIFNPSKSTLKANFVEKNNILYHGGQEYDFPRHSIFVLGSGIISPQGNTILTLFDDAQNNRYTSELVSEIEVRKDFTSQQHHVSLDSAPIILSERPLPSSIDSTGTYPLTISAKLYDALEPGVYNLSFVLTYFNGAQWKNDRLQVPIKVQNWYERNDGRIQNFGIVIVFLTLLTFILTLPSQIKAFLRPFRKRLKKWKKRNKKK